MKLQVIGLMLAFVASASGSALAVPDGGMIGLYFDQHGTVCADNVPLYTQTTLYIYAKPDLNLPGNGGITGAEFRIKGATSSMLITPTASPASNVSLGNPFSDESQQPGSRGGANIAFPTCQEPDENCNVLLYTVSLTLIAIEPDIVFEVDQKDPPANFGNQFALVNACDGPVFTVHEVYGLLTFMNHYSPGYYCQGSPGGCTTAVEEKAWSSIKKMYE